MRIQLIGAAVAVLAGSFVVWWGKDHIEATVAGLALLYALQFTDALKYLVRQHALLEMQMNSVRMMTKLCIYMRDVRGGERGSSSLTYLVCMILLST